VEGVTATGGWSVGGEVSCITNSLGYCSVSKNNLKTSVNSIDFTISNLEQTGYTYLGFENHDDETDSDGTTITIYAPN
jgi:hypothetical protein